MSRVTGDCVHLCDKCADTLDDIGTVNQPASDCAHLCDKCADTLDDVGTVINLAVTGVCAHLCNKCANTLDDVGTVVTFDDNVKVHDDPFGFLPVSRATHLLKMRRQISILL